MTAIERVIATAKSQIGYLEKKTNDQLEDFTANAGYNNWNKFAAFLDNLGVVYNGKKNGYSWCGGRTRWGTDRKQSTIKKYYKTINKEIVEYIGIAADEFERIPRARAKGQILPLVDTNMTEKDALDFCYKKGYNWLEGNIDLYDIMDRVSCWCCKNNNLKELRNMYHYLPEYWGKLKDMQNKTLFPYKNYTYKGTSYGTIEDLEYRFYCEDNNKEWIF